MPAYDGLSDDTKERIDGLVAVHDHVKSFGHQVPPEQRDEIRAKYPPVEHPVVRTHPETGRRILYVNRFFTSHIVGLDPDESLALIDELSRRAEIVEYQCRFRWTPDAVVMWDNRAVQHYACSDYWPSVRVMERASIVETPPPAEPGSIISTAISQLRRIQLAASTATLIPWKPRRRGS